MTLYIMDHISVDVTGLDEKARAKLRKAIESAYDDVVGAPPAPPGPPAPPAPEPPEIINEVLTRLIKEGAAAQHAVITSMVDSGAKTISRKEVYKIGKFSDDRSLRGFTRSVRRVLTKLA